MHEAIVVLLVWTISLVHAQDAGPDDSNSYDFDPILQYRPDFSRSLPVQILVTGVVLTLVVVLLIHLIFTRQYHWPLAPVNYVLQLSSVLTLLIFLISTLHVILSSALQESKEWPYMLSYIAVTPCELKREGRGWSVTETLTWLIMTSIASGLVQITHIQFLTLLYPSPLEARLIYILLGPLAFVAAMTQILLIISDSKAILIVKSTRNVCYATLSLIFTFFLLIWGFLVNRHQAWRLEGGTTVFGASALLLALVGTALNFLEVPREDQYVWLPGLIHAIVLWQSFLGFWWWVGAGSGAGLVEVEERLRKEEKRKESRKERQGRRKEIRQRAMWTRKDVTDSPPPMSLSADEVEPTLRESGHEQQLRQEDENANCPANTWRFLPRFAQRWLNHVLQAHATAARAQAVERIERMRKRQKEGKRWADGWGLGNFKHSSSTNCRDASESTERPECAQDHEPEVPPKEKMSIWYWGPLRKWRLQDSTVY